MSKGIYVGVDGVARKVSKLYVGVDGVARRVLKAYIGDANGIARQVYAAEKAYWWKRYAVNSWTSEIMAVMGTDGDVDGQFQVSKDGHALFSSYSFNASTGLYTLSGSTSVTWVYDHTDGNTAYYSLATNCKNTYATSGFTQVNASSGRALYNIATGSGWEDDGIPLSIFHLDCLSAAHYAKPASHATSYTLVKGTTSSYPPTEGYDHSLDNGYSYSQQEYSGEYTYKFYDGYYWVYDGYHE